MNFRLFLVLVFSFAAKAEILQCPVNEHPAPSSVLCQSTLQGNISYGEPFVKFSTQVLSVTPDPKYGFVCKISYECTLTVNCMSNAVINSNVQPQGQCKLNNGTYLSGCKPNQQVSLTGEGTETQDGTTVGSGIGPDSSADFACAMAESSADVWCGLMGINNVNVETAKLGCEQDLQDKANSYTVEISGNSGAMCCFPDVSM